MKKILIVSAILFIGLFTGLNTNSVYATQSQQAISQEQLQEMSGVLKATSNILNELKIMIKNHNKAIANRSSEISATLASIGDNLSSIKSTVTELAYNNKLNRVALIKKVKNIKQSNNEATTSDNTNAVASTQNNNTSENSVKNEKKQASNVMASELPIWRNKNITIPFVLLIAVLFIMFVRKLIRKSKKEEAEAPMVNMQHMGADIKKNANIPDNIVQTNSNINTKQNTDTENNKQSTLLKSNEETNKNNNQK